MDNWDVPQIGNIYVHFHSGSIFQLCLFKWRCELLIISTDDRRYVSQHRDFPIVNKPTHPPQQPRYSWSNIQFRFRKVPPRGTSRSKTPRRYGAKGFDLNRVQVEGMWWPSDCRVWWKHTTSKLSRKFWRFVFLHRNDLCFWNFGGVFLLVAKIFQNTHTISHPLVDLHENIQKECSFGSDDCPFQFGMIFQLPAVGSFFRTRLVLMRMEQKKCRSLQGPGATRM